MRAVTAIFDYRLIRSLVYRHDDRLGFAAFVPHLQLLKCTQR